ncbi:hypothetical protein [Rhodococcus ruber]|uniref:hypothetical protein n=1 Tax=Rhodococcus ruber TaxID=1830 RepID=UPI001AEB7D4F|nr:hypothetical protein [Rhodococcus ruber]
MHVSTSTAQLRAVLQLTRTRIEVVEAQRLRTTDPARLLRIAEELEHSRGYRDALEQALRECDAVPNRPSARATRLSRCVSRIAAGGDARQVAALERVLHTQLLDRTRALVRLTATGDHPAVHRWACRHLARCRNETEPGALDVDAAGPVRSR